MFPCHSYAQTDGLGVGIVFGEPCGFDAKRWIDESTAIEFAIGFSPAMKNNRVTMHLDYIWNNLQAIHTRERFALHYGLGVRYAARKDGTAKQGFRLIGGIMWYPVHKIPFEFYAEIAPVIAAYPYFGMSLDAGAGFRYYFSTND